MYVWSSVNCGVSLVTVVTEHAILKHNGDCQVLVIYTSGVPPYLENHENLESCNLLFKACKIPEFAQKVAKTWNINSKPGKKMKFVNLVLQDKLFKMSFTNKFPLHLCHIYIINTKHNYSKPNWLRFSLFLRGNNLENAWTFVSTEKWEPWCW